MKITRFAPFNLLLPKSHSAWENRLDILTDKIYISSSTTMAPQYNQLTDEEKRVIEHKGTEAPFTGEYDDFYVPGTFICRRCNLPLFSSKAKFDAHCGWPAFDDSFPGALQRLPDPDGSRTEIECSNCHAHLGHEFTGEELTEKNTRECVNSVSIKFVPEGKELPKVIGDNSTD